MTTLATLKAQIADDLDRSDGSIDTAIATEITNAIRHYQRFTFYWNGDIRDVTFSTVASQTAYGATDAAAIPYAIKIDLAHITVSGQRYELSRRNYLELETLYDTTAASGEPYEYAYYDQQVWLYPIPNAAYTVRLLGLFRVDAPASDAEAGNPWMTEAFELIRCRAKVYLAAHKLRDPELAATMQAAEEDALRQLRKETALRSGTGNIVSTRF
jgi:hypothetical protein